ncbi:ubiquitin carboxyl-terminal hydrolase 5 [Naematelia encephala]|uniref:ubiquitinyl hydrolase 1 n=1 Tax=Naematelia encephala TaxID=71784 RepID=A0A1Y2APE4_9TREE|nr:ubiquitin carboxyl-terminal hydrolase 5 [Naematelia encephala]
MQQQHHGDVTDIIIDDGPAPMEVEELPNVRDFEAYANKAMPDLGLDIEDFQAQTWRIENWSQQPKRIVGPEFSCGGHKWRILLFPQGNANGQPNDMVSVYLDYANPKTAPEGWHACAQFCLAISNPWDPTIQTSSHAHHRFVAEECDWGFTRFVDLRKLYTPDTTNGKTRPTIENDEVEITAFVRVLKDPTGVLWHNFVNYDSKKETGHVGLKNQGATCYMNSLLQSLYCTNYFRKAVYQIPTDNDVPSESLALALQRVFYHLQTSHHPVGTTELTKSFGWKSLDSFMQHDVQEFSRILQDKLEIKMKGTPAEGAIPKLFKGTMKNYVKCIDVDQHSIREEDFYDVQLTIKGLKSLAESFREYIQVETLEGDNMYYAEGFGLQRANKGVIFSSFPPVLHLQLRRFEYDVEKDALVKINDRHEFPFEIDLADYLDEDADRSVSHVYKLHGVLVHSGDLHGGHYFALIKPEKDGRWFKFDDDRVTPVTDKEVLEDNYGGDMLNGLIPPHQRTQARTLKKFTNAYMLVYIRESELDTVLAPFTEGDTPSHLKARLDAEKEQSEAKRREKDEQHLYLTAKVITDDIFGRHQGFDLASFDDKNLPATELPTFRVLKTETYLTFKQRIAQFFKYNERDFRLWVLVNRQNKTIRPDVPIHDNDNNQTMEYIRNQLAARANDLRLYLDYNPDHANFNALHADPSSPPIMIFLKWFDCSRQTLTGQGKVFVNKNDKVGSLLTHIQERMGWPPSTPIKLYEEIKAGMIEGMKLKQTFVQNEIQDGDVICYQVELTDKEAADLEAQSLYSSVPAFYEFLQNRVLVQFKPRYEDQASKAPDFDLMLSKKMTYDVMALRVGDYLKHDPLKLRFTSSNPQSGSPKAIIKRALNQSVADITSTNYYSPHPNVIVYYELLDISIIELETKKSLKVVWTGRTNKEEATHSFLLPKTSTFSDVAENLAKTVKMQPGGSGRIRIFDVSPSGRSQREYTSSEMIGNLTDPAELYAEEIPLDELNAPENSKIVNLFHYQRDPSRTHGVPCKFVLVEGEPFSVTKGRIQERIGVSEKDFGRYKFSLITSTIFKQPAPVEEDDVLYDHKWAADDALGLDHPDKRPNKNTAEKGIVMR